MRDGFARPRRNPSSLRLESKRLPSRLNGSSAYESRVGLTHDCARGERGGDRRRVLTTLAAPEGRSHRAVLVSRVGPEHPLGSIRHHTTGADAKPGVVVAASLFLSWAVGIRGRCLCICRIRPAMPTLANTRRTGSRCPHAVLAAGSAGEHYPTSRQGPRLDVQPLTPIHSYAVSYRDQRDRSRRANGVVHTRYRLPGSAANASSGPANLIPWPRTSVYVRRQGYRISWRVCVPPSCSSKGHRVHEGETALLSKHRSSGV
jgi:hypothetical protein